MGWLRSVTFLTGIFVAPMLVDRGRHLRQPGAIFEDFNDVNRSEVFNAVRRRIAQGPKHPIRDQDWHIVGLAAQGPRRLLDS
jgi:hypothetical protein